MSKSIIFDTETTGLDEEDRIIQVGAITVDSRDKEYFEIQDELCSDDIPIKIEAMSIHGIRQVQVDGKPSFKESTFFKHLNKLNSEENYLIAHNLDFDLGMLKKEGFDNKMQLIDTLQCAKHVFEIGDEINGYKVPNHKLQTFRYMMLSQEEEDEEAKKYAVEIKAHDAIGDVVILKLFLKKLAEKVMKKYNLKRYIELMDKMVELTKLPAEVKIINFGQYKGEKLLDIEERTTLNKWGKQEGQSYVDWLYKDQKEKKESQDLFFNNDLFYTLGKIIKNRDKNAGTV